MKRLSLLFAALLLLVSFASAQVVITTDTIPDGFTNNIFYSQALSATISPPLNTINATLTWSLASGSLPPGLNLDPNSGAITGNPTTVGAYPFTVMVQINFTGFTNQHKYTINISTPQVRIATDSPLPTTAVFEPYSQTLKADTNPPLALLWAVSSALLPSGLTMSSQGVISGSAQVTGTYTFNVTASLSNTGVSDVKTFTIQVFQGRVRITSPSPLPAATLGQSFTYTFTSVPGQNVTWSTIYTLPGLKLDANTGTLSGIPTSTGTYTFTIQANAPGYSQDTEPFTLFITTGSLSITETSLPLAILSAPYSALLHANGGLAPYTWALTGSSPPGLTINPNTGAFSGTPTAVGQYNFAVQVSDTAGTKFPRFFNLFVAGPVVINTTSLPNGILGASYSQTLSAGGGQPPYTWTIPSGNIPPGLQFSSSGTLIGAPTRNGTYQFTVQVTDNGLRTASQVLTITVGGISVVTSSLPDAGINVLYLQNLQVFGGTAPYTWTLIGGSLPAGLTLDPSGRIQGTATTAGTTQFTVQVTDGSQTTGQQQLSIKVVPALQLGTSVLPGGSLGKAYTQTLTVSGGSPPYNFALISGALPAGLSLDPASGAISGTPTTAGTYTFVVMLTDQGVQQIRQAYTVVVSGQTSITITAGNLTGIVGTAFSQTLSASGGAAPYVWTLASGALPPGLTLSSSGIISGTPTSAGSFTVTPSVADAAGLTAQQSITITIALATLPTLTIGLSPDTSLPAQQPQVTVTLSAPYFLAVSGTITLTFQSSVGADDQSVRFSNGSRTAPYTIAAGSTQSQVVMVAGPTVATVPVTVLTGTTAGTIKLTATVQAGGNDVTPNPAPSTTVTIATSAPVISSVALQPTGSTLNVIVTGYSTTRDMVSGLFHFAPTTGSTLSQTDLTVQLGTAFATWYSNSASNATGSQFVLTMPFNISQGSPSSISAVTVTLTNSKGASAAVSP